MNAPALRLALFIARVALCSCTVLVSAAAHAADTAFGEPALYEAVIDPIVPAVKPFPRARGHDVVTQRNNNQRTGTSEWLGFNQASVSGGRFGLLKTLAVDGPILAQPLFLESVEFRLSVGTVTHSVVYVATAKNRVCAFDADPPFNALWNGCTWLGEPFSTPVCGPNDNECAARQACPGQMLNAENDPNLYIGIEATPVIDRALQRMFVSYRTRNHRQRIAALDIATGAISADVDVDDDPRWNLLHRSRASLLLVGDVLFVAFAGACEAPNRRYSGEYFASYQGWVYAFDSRTLTRLARYRTTQSDDRSFSRPYDDPVAGGGIWQASTGLAADVDGNIFFSTGNATGLPGQTGQVAPNPSWKNLSSSVVHLRVVRETPTSQPPRTTLNVVDWFTPYRKVWQDRIDLDLGAAGVVLIPGTTFLITGGKEGILYLLDVNRLGKFDGTPPFEAATVLGNHKTAASVPDDPNRDHVAQKISAAHNRYCEEPRSPLKTFRLARLFCFDDGYVPTASELLSRAPSMDAWLPWPHIHGTPVFGQFADGSAFLYVWPEKDNLKSFRWLGNQFDTRARIALSLAPAGQQRQEVLAPPYLAGVPFAAGMPGGMLSLNVDRSRSNGGVLFASVQRCRDSNQGASRYECSISVCENAPGCQGQLFGMLRAFDPITLNEFWNDQADPSTAEADKNYWFAKYVPPTIAKGRVFLATGSGKVLVYGTRSQ